MAKFVFGYYDVFKKEGKKVVFNDIPRMVLILG